MPLLHSTFKGSPFRWSGHLETITTGLLREVDLHYKRERFWLPDTDFIDLDWIENSNDQLLVLFHGLEGSAQSQYIKGFARYFKKHQWDCCAVNFRSCSGELNKLLRSYHSGASDDVDLVMKHIIKNHHYKSIALIGFSLGGNVLLKYLGEQQKQLPTNIIAAAAVSVPADLEGSAIKMSRLENRLYMIRFLRSLHTKMKAKAKQFPNMLDVTHLHQIKNFHQFDDRFTAPIHGFKDAHDYYQKCSAIHFIPDIAVPTLILNAKNDPFLNERCFPMENIKHHPFVFGEYPKYGGHVGFLNGLPNGSYWSEKRVWDFFQQQIFK